MYCLQGVQRPHIPEMFHFDRDTVRVFRDELNAPNLDITFHPGQMRFGPGIASDREHWSWYPGRRGCWQVTVEAWSQDVGDLGGATMAWTIPVAHTIFIVGGQGGTPLIPGRWLIGILDSKDRAKHGWRELERQADELRRENFLRDHRAGDKSFVEKWRDDPHLYRMLRKRGQELLGVTPFSREEGIAAERDAEARLASIAAHQEKQALEQTVWGKSTPDV